MSPRKKTGRLSAGSEPERPTNWRRGPEGGIRRGGPALRGDARLRRARLCFHVLAARSLGVEAYGRSGCCGQRSFSSSSSSSGRSSRRHPARLPTGSRVVKRYARSCTRSASSISPSLRPRWLGAADLADDRRTPVPRRRRVRRGSRRRHLRLWDRLHRRGICTGMRWYSGAAVGIMADAIVRLAVAFRYSSSHRRS